MYCTKQKCPKHRLCRDKSTGLFLCLGFTKSTRSFCFVGPKVKRQRHHMPIKKPKHTTVNLSSVVTYSSQLSLTLRRSLPPLLRQYASNIQISPPCTTCTKYKQASKQIPDLELKRRPMSSQLPAKVERPCSHLWLRSYDSQPAVKLLYQHLLE